MLTLPEAAVLVELVQDGPKTIAELSVRTGDLAVGIGLTVMHLEHARLIIGHGLPRQYGLTDTGYKAMRDWRRVAGALVEKAWQG